MRKRCSNDVGAWVGRMIAVGLSCLFVPHASPLPDNKTPEKISQSNTAIWAYDNGFATNLMRAGDGSSVKLDDMILYEDDAPGAGKSEKGTYIDEIYGPNVVRKILKVRNPRSLQSHLVFFTDFPVPPKKAGVDLPLTIDINGHVMTYDVPKHHEQFHWVPFDPSWLIAGENTITFSCPRAKNPKEGWMLDIARADEFAAGGGQDRDPGKLSLKSVDEGTTFKTGALGKTNDVKGEYAIRLNLRQYESRGELTSPVIDLWRDPASTSVLIPLSNVTSMTLTFSADVPEGASVEWDIRQGYDRDPFSGDWSEYTRVGSGPRVDFKIEQECRRFLQWRATLSTSIPTSSPTVKTVGIERDVIRTSKTPTNIVVVGNNNQQIRYSSIGFVYEDAAHPQLQEIRKRAQTDDVLKGCVTEFDRLVRLRDWAANLWVWGWPTPEYPKWNAMDILDRLNKHGQGGFCHQYAVLLAHVYTACGYQARHASIFVHEVTEVWSNDYAKWVFMDPTQGMNRHEFDTQTGAPLGLEEMHRHFLTAHRIKTPIDWQAGSQPWDDNKKSARLPAPVDYSTPDSRIVRATEQAGGYTYGYLNAGFVRMMPRNNFSSAGAPEPRTHGEQQWPWDGYVNWYDELTPRMLQYSRHTDRACDFWPTLNAVSFDAVVDPTGKGLVVSMVTFAPNFETFMVGVNDGEWTASPSQYRWQLSPGINTLKMRVRTKPGVLGHPSVLQVNYHPRPKTNPSRLGDVD